MASRRGQGGVNGVIIGVVVAVVIIAAVAIPVVQDVIANQSYTGTTGTLMDLIPLFLALAALVVVASIFS